MHVPKICTRLKSNSTLIFEMEVTIKVDEDNHHIFK